MLLQLGCEQGQGFGIAHPMPAHAFVGWVQQWRPDPTWLGQGSVGRHDLPLLFAGVEHHAWLQSIGKYLRDGSGTLPVLDSQHCHFGKWIANEGAQRYGASSGFKQLVNLHEEMHALAVRYCRMRDEGDVQPEEFDVLHALQRAFDAQLRIIGEKAALHA